MIGYVRSISSSGASQAEPECPPPSAEAARQAAAFSIPELAKRVPVGSRESTHPNQPRAHDRDGLVLGRRDIVDHGRVPDDGRQRVAVDVGAPFPASGVGVAGADVFRLQALEFLLGAEFVGLVEGFCQYVRSVSSGVQYQLTIVLDVGPRAGYVESGKADLLLALQCLWRRVEAGALRNQDGLLHRRVRPTPSASEQLNACPAADNLQK